MVLGIGLFEGPRRHQRDVNRDAGSFAFFCDKKAPFMASHREKGMVGVLEVR